jgi:ribosomal protein L11 methyltransferase
VTNHGPWVTVRVSPGTRREAVIAALFQGGIQGLQEIGDTIVTQVPGQDIASELVCAVMATSPDAQIETEPLPDVDWSEQWKKGIRAQRVGALTIAPPWLADELEPSRSIIIDPGMAFGTGEHATTRGVIRLMQQVIREGDHVADLGTGSAVLAIAAAKLGAARVAAIELDHDAIENAEENVIRNGVAERVTVIEGDAGTLLPLVGPVRVVTANIISSVLIDLLPVVAFALGDDGRAIVSGILQAECDEMRRSFEDSGWTMEAEDHEDIWWSATLARQ